LPTASSSWIATASPARAARARPSSPSTLVERHLGHAAAVKALRIMIIDGEPAGEAPQPGIPVAF
jgi:hypothetical protein